MLNFMNLNASCSLSNIFTSPSNRLSYRLLLLFTGIIALTISAQLSIPLQPIPLTFQSATVILIGMTMGMQLSGEIVAIYLVLGSLGLPVFANFAGGLPVLLGTHGGYLMGFLPATLLSGYLAKKGLAKSALSSFIASFLGTIVIFFFGFSWLSHFIGFSQAYHLGVEPLLLTECIKLLAIAFIIPRCWK